MNGPTFATPATSVRTAPVPPRSAPAARGANRAPEPSAPPILTWLRLHWLMILFCGSLLGSGLAYAAWTLLPSEYESYALLRVASAPFSIANQRDPNRSKTDFATYMKTNRQLIKYEFVLNSALNLPQSGIKDDVVGPRIADLATIKQQKEPIKYLDEKLLVDSADGSEVIRISLKGHNPGDIQKVVNAVQAAFIAEVVEKETKERNRFATEVEQAVVKLADQLNRKIGTKPDAVLAGLGLGNDQAPMMPAAGLPMPNPAQGNGPPESVRKALTSLLIQDIARLRRDVEKHPIAIQSLKNRIAALQRQVDVLKTGPTSREVLEAVENDPEVKELKAQATYHRTKYQHDAATYQNKDAPVLKASLVAAERAEERLAKMKQTKAHEMELAKRQAKADELYPLLDQAMRNLQEYEELFRADTQLLANKQAELAQLPPDPVAEDAPRADGTKAPKIDPTMSELEVHDDAFRSLSLYATQLRLDQESPDRVSILQTASVPMQKDRKKQILGTLVAGMMGFVLVAFGAFGYEMHVKKVSKLSELQQTCATPVVGVIPHNPRERLNPVQLGDVTEAVDKLRGYVAQTWLARGATTVAITSTIEDEGKAHTAFALASSLCSGGYKTLLVDFDLRHPTLHTLAGVSNENGVCNLLTGDGDFRNTIQTLASGLHVLPAGAWTDAARQAAVGGKLEALLNRLREPFDCVILHTHSLLTAAESLEVARRSEVVLLCVMHRETRTPLVKRATERIANMEVPYSGLVYLGATVEESLC